MNKKIKNHNKALLTKFEDLKVIELVCKSDMDIPVGGFGRRGGFYMRGNIQVFGKGGFFSIEADTH